MRHLLQAWASILNVTDFEIGDRVEVNIPELDVPVQGVVTTFVPGGNALMVRFDNIEEVAVVPTQIATKVGAKTAGVQQAFDRAFAKYPFDLDAQSFAAEKAKRWQAMSWQEALDMAMKWWRSSFANSSNIRAYLDGRGPAPAYDDFTTAFMAEVIRQALTSSGSMGRETWRIEMGGAHVGATREWPVKAVALKRSEALQFRMSLTTDQYGAIMYRVPADAQGVWFPDGREGIVSGRFTVTEVSEPDETGLVEATLQTAGSVL